MAFRPRSFAQPGQMLLIRAGNVVADYGNSRVSAADYGNGFLAALAAAQSGDTLMCGPLCASLVNATLTASNVKILCTGTELNRSGNYTHLFKSTGDDNYVEGLIANGAGTANTGSGVGLYITGDRNHFHQCEANGTRGTTPTNGDGTGLRIDGNTDTVITSYRSTDSGYNAVWFRTANRVTLDGAEIVNCVRSMGFNSTTDLDWIQVSNVNAVNSTVGNSALMNMNIDDGVALDELRMTNIALTDTDMISAGYSYNSASGNQLMKLQNTTNIYLDNVNLTHGLNAGAGGGRTFYIQSYLGNVAPDRLIVKNSSFSDNMVFGLKVPYMLWEGCRFGVRQSQATVAWYTLHAELAQFHGCEFNIHGASRVFTTSASQATTDRYEFKHSKFKADNASNVFLTQLSGSGNLGTYAGNILFDETNSLSNSGAGDFLRSNDRFETLAWTTDRNGDMLLDDGNIWSGSGSDDGKHPIPGGSAPYFSGLGVPANGKRIWNINWSPDDTQVVPEKGFISHGGEWKELT